MNTSLYIAATGMQAQQLGLDAIANNLTNLNTPGFKSSIVNFQELMYSGTSGAHAVDGASHLQRVNRSVGGHVAGAANPIEASDSQDAFFGAGVAVGSTTKDFTTGTLTQTNSQLDLAIQGNGFIEVVMPDGSLGYTRGGTLSVSKDNFLLSPQGYELKPSIRIPANVSGLTISATGQVSVTTGTSSVATQVGQIELASFSNPGALTPLGNGLYVPADAAGRVTYGKPGDSNTGTLSQGFIEGSNVNMVSQMVNLMVAQRAYELSAKVVQTSDELMSMTNNLRR